MMTKETNSAKIIVCTHQACHLPQRRTFLPVQVGKALTELDLRIQGDNMGEHISIKNKSFCELTAMYWAWKNIRQQHPEIVYVGLCHYRRYLALDRFLLHRINVDKLPSMRGYGWLTKYYMRKYDIILPYRRSITEISIRHHYEIHHHASDLHILEQVVHELFPMYDSSFRFVFDESKTMSLCNIFIARYEFFDAYCSWLFAILHEAEHRIDISTYDTYQQRIFGFMAERLLNVYVHYHQPKVLYKPVFFVK